MKILKHAMTPTIATMTPEQAGPFTMASFTAAAHELQPGLPTEPVHLKYWNHAWNPMFLRREAVFACFKTADMTLAESDFLGHWYEGALENFKQ